MCRSGSTTGVCCCDGLAKAVRSLLCRSVVIFAVLLAMRVEAAPHIVRIGTAESTGLYYPVGQLLASLFSERTGDQCAPADACGIRDAVVVAQRATGSVANVRALREGGVDMALVQADVAYQAFVATGVFADAAAFADLRVIARLYPEAVHVVSSGGRGITSIHDLRGKRVALDEPGSGTLNVARAILRAYGILDDISPQFVKPSIAQARLRDGRVDAFFSVAGYPVPSVKQALEIENTVLLPIEGQRLEQLTRELTSFQPGVIPTDVYTGVPPTPTLFVPALLVTTTALESELGYRMTELLWSERAMRSFERELPEVVRLVREDALKGVNIPVHAGAQRWYEEASVSKP